MATIRGCLGLVCVLTLSWTALPGQVATERKQLLFLTHAGFYKHASLGQAEAAVTSWGRRGGFEVTVLEGYKQTAPDLDLSMITPEYLARFDGVMMMTNGNLPLSQTQREGLIDFVRNGGGFIGVHCATLTLYDHPEFGEMLGAYFLRPVQQNRIFILKVEDRDHPATRMLGSSWPISDELYMFGTATWNESRPEENVDTLFGNKIPVGLSRDRVRVLLSLDMENSNLDQLRYIDSDGDYPQAWCREFGQGRSFYTSLGHRGELWSDDPVFRAHVVGGIRWILGLEDGNATPTGSRREEPAPKARPGDG